MPVMIRCKCVFFSVGHLQRPSNKRRKLVAKTSMVTIFEFNKSLMALLFTHRWLEWRGHYPEQAALDASTLSIFLIFTRRVFAAMEHCATCKWSWYSLCRVDSTETANPNTFNSIDTSSKELYKIVNLGINGTDTIFRSTIAPAT